MIEFQTFLFSKAFLIIRNGASIKQSKMSSGTPITRIETIANKIVDPNKFGYADITGNKYLDYYLREGDILLSHINSLDHIGKSAYYNDLGYPVIHGMNLLCLRVNPEILNPKFTFYFFQTKYFKKQILRYVKKSVNQVSIPISSLSKVKISFPSLPDQIRIVKVLTKAEDLIAKRKESIHLLDELIKSTFLDMFGDPLVTRQWEIKKLGDITNLITDGKHGNCIDDENSGYYFISAKDIHDGLIDYTNARQILYEDFQEVDNRTNLTHDDVVVVNTGATIGKTAIVLNDDKIRRTTFQKSVAIIKLKQNIINPQYLKYVFVLRIKNLSGNSYGSAVKNMLLSEMRKFKIPTPPILLQNKFSKIVEKIESIKSKYQTSLTELENLYGSLSQRAFKGELDLSWIEVIEKN